MLSHPFHDETVKRMGHPAISPDLKIVWIGSGGFFTIEMSVSYGQSKGVMLPSFAMTKGVAVSADKSEVLQGTLDLMILKTLHALGPLHGFGIARRIEQVSEDLLSLNEGTVYTSLLRLQQRGWIKSEWGVSENNRRARFYSITKQGLKQLVVETENWERIAGVIGRVLRQEGGR